MVDKQIREQTNTAEDGSTTTTQDVSTTDFKTFRNSYTDNGILNFQVVLDSIGNEVSTYYYYWSKFNGTSIETPEVSAIQKPEMYFDLSGRPVDGTQKGIYIRNGKKVLVR